MLHVEREGAPSQPAKKPKAKQGRARCVGGKDSPVACKQSGGAERLSFNKHRMCRHCRNAVAHDDPKCQAKLDEHEEKCPCQRDHAQELGASHAGRDEQAVQASSAAGMAELPRVREEPMVLPCSESSILQYLVQHLGDGDLATALAKARMLAGLEDAVFNNSSLSGATCTRCNITVGAMCYVRQEAMAPESKGKRKRKGGTTGISYNTKVFCHLCGDSSKGTPSRFWSDG